MSRLRDAECRKNPEHRDHIRLRRAETNSLRCPACTTVFFLMKTRTSQLRSCRQKLSRDWKQEDIVKGLSGPYCYLASRCRQLIFTIKSSTAQPPPRYKKGFAQTIRRCPFPLQLVQGFWQAMIQVPLRISGVGVPWIKPLCRRAS